MGNKKDIERIKEVLLFIKGASLEMLYLLEDTTIKEINNKQQQKENIKKWKKIK